MHLILQSRILNFFGLLRESEVELLGGVGARIKFFSCGRSSLDISSRVPVYLSSSVFLLRKGQRHALRHLFVLVLFIHKVTVVAYLLIINGQAKDLGAKLNCPVGVMTPSPSPPTNVNRVRFADIDVIAAMGDSLTVGVDVS